MNVLLPRETFTDAYRPFKPTKEDMTKFNKALEEFLNDTDIDADEEHNKNFIAPFLRKFAYKDTKYKINTVGKIDLAISKNGYVEVLIEVKRPYSKKNSVPDMVKSTDMNRKAFREALLYYMRQVDPKDGIVSNPYVKHIIITNNIEWFIIESQFLAKLAKHPEIKTAYKQIDKYGTASNTSTEAFYKKTEEIIKNYDLLRNLSFVYIDLSKEHTQTELKDIYKLFTPRHLLKEYGANDSNTLNKKFYNELLHIIGLEEVGKGKKIIQRKAIETRDSGSLLENTIRKLETEFGISDENELFEKGLELNITWLNRLLFLKLLDSHLHSIHGNTYKKFLDRNSIVNYDVLNTLFFEVLAIKTKERKKDIVEQFGKIPYLNSSLFEATHLEQSTLRISGLKDDMTMTVISSTKTGLDKSKAHNTLDYLITFLDAYNFSSDASKILKSESDSLINASVLGLIFEKINGYKDGSFFTPSFITMYMTKESLRKTVIEKFNEAYKINAESIKEVKTYLVASNLHYKENDKKYSNKIINQITILDPAVGSGHFLVSALNELLVIKSELGLLNNLETYSVSNEDDELLILDNNDDVFIYSVNAQGNIPKEKALVQKSIFLEKQRIIENQIFGVDINPNSVKITQLRLWIELLKHSYYENDELVTLPNIDINIKCGNSLISRFALNDADNDKKETKKLLKKMLPEYKALVKQYKGENNKKLKKQINDNIATHRKNFKKALVESGKFITLLSKFIYEYGTNNLSFELQKVVFDKSITKTQPSLSGFSVDEDKRNKAYITLNKEFNKYTNLQQTEIYKDSFEWRFQFPEVLDDDGEFIGFDIVIGNPPYLSNKDISQNDKKAYKDIYKLSDDLYNYFLTKSFQLLKKNGLLNFITSNTFMTIASKINIRHLLQSKKIIELMPIKNPFEEAAVEPIIVFAQNTEMSDDYSFDYVDLRKKDFTPLENRLKINIDIYRNTPSQVFFTPTEQNKKIHSKYISKSKDLLDKYWSKISTSKNIAKNKNELDIYRNNLKAGDNTLLGLVTDGGQGLATANNGKYIGVKNGTKEAFKIEHTRADKLQQFNKKYHQNYTIDNLSELEIRELFDRLKEEYDRDIFGQGYLYRIVLDSEIADVELLTDDEKINGIDGNSFVPYDKGDRDGNKWYFETPFYIDWNRNNVAYLKNNSGKKGKGMPVLRNPQFYFKDGFSWNNVLNPNSTYIKSKLKENSINDVASMSLYPLNKNISAKYIITLLNSYFIFKYLRDIINNTVNLQINDFRQIPIIIPTNEQLKQFENIFDEAKKIKVQQFSKTISKEEANSYLDNIQKRVDKMVYELYDLSGDEIKIIEENTK